MFEKYLNKTELIENLQVLIKIPSVHAESSVPNEPFGLNTVKALEYVLDLGKKLGFKAKNIDGYCGYIEFGEGSELIGIVGHLDVVPEGENWTYPPFDARIEDNKIYGRGAIDDKGPVMASLYAMKAVMDYCSENNISINKRVRLILGLNEERDWKCINYYKEHEEIPSIGFSPDADFPCIYAEKGLLSPFLIMDYSNFKDKDIILSDINCNNNPLNVVPKYCSCTISVKNNIDIDYENLINMVVSEAIDYVKCPYECEVNVTIVDNDEIHEINNSQRNIDRPTDVLSFPMLEYDKPGDFDKFGNDLYAFDPDTGELTLGDIVISYDKVISQAEEYNHSVKREFAFLVAHSMLHLFGYDHIDDNERMEMERKQKEILNNLGITRE